MIRFLSLWVGGTSLALHWLHQQWHINCRGLFFGEHSFYLECTLLIPKTQRPNKDATNLKKKRRKRAEEEQGEHSFIFCFIAKVLLGWRELSVSCITSQFAFIKSIHTLFSRHAILLPQYKLLEHQTFQTVISVFSKSSFHTHFIKNALLGTNYMLTYLHKQANSWKLQTIL